MPFQAAATVTHATPGTGGGPLTLSLNAASAANRGVFFRVDVISTASPATLGSPTYGGVGLTAVDAGLTYQGYKSFLYYLVGASVPTGPNSFSITYTGDITEALRITALAYSGVSAVSGIAYNAEGGGVVAGGTATFTVTTTAGDMAIAFLSSTGAETSSAPGGSETERYDDGTYYAYEKTAAGASTDVTLVPAGGTAYYSGWVFSLTPAAGGPTRKLKCLVEPAAIGSTVRYGAVFAAPTGAAGSKVTGAKIGEFESVAFQTGSGADTGYAVLKVPVADFGGGALSTSDTPVVYLEDVDESTYMFPATVIDE
jgi:hypothetical protein